MIAWDYWLLLKTELQEDNIMNTLFLIVEIAGERIALPSHEVESVVRVENIVIVPGVSPVIAGLFALRSRVLTLIDTQFLVTEESRLVHKGDFCIVTEIDGHPYGLIVDNVEDVVTVKQGNLMHIGFANKKWRAISNGMITHDEKLLLLLNLRSLVKIDILVAA